MAPVNRDHPGVIAPPPLIFVGVLAAGFAVHFAVGGPGFGWPTPVQWAATLLFALGAAAFIASALMHFRAAKTSARPWLPTTAIVSTGVYGLTRNPMYLGMAMLYAAIALALDSVIVLALLVVAAAIIDVGVIRREERYLEAKFGEDYRRYKAAVRRWI